MFVGCGELNGSGGGVFVVGGHASKPIQVHLHTRVRGGPTVDSTSDGNDLFWKWIVRVSCAANEESTLHVI